MAGVDWHVRTGRRDVVVKTGAGVLDEAAGLRQLASIEGGPPVPEVLVSEPELLVTSYVQQAARTGSHEEALGRSLAALHGAAWLEWGGGSSYIGSCQIDPTTFADGPTFYAARLSELAARCGLERPVSSVTDRLSDLLPTGSPALLHGDLWWGNVLWGSDGRGWLIDPSVHGGHPEEDIAMLGLFGRLPGGLLAAYAEVRPLADGWRERTPLFQLYPLLVHTVLFGGGYREQALEIARRYGARSR